MIKNVTIARLQDYPHLASVCGEWDDAVWPRNPAIEDFFADHYSEAALNQGNEAPQVWIAIHDGNPIGMMSLITDDHPDFPHLSPWLASAYVLPQYRGQGVFRALHDQLVKFARTQTGYSALYVYSHVDFSTLGDWLAIDRISDPFEEGHIVTLYKNNL